MVKQSVIARDLHLSQQTVSRVLNQPHLVRERTRNRVLEAIKRHGYHPNELANRFKSRSLKMLGICLPSIQHSYFPSIAQGLEQAANQRGWQISITCSQGRSVLERDHLLTMRSLRFGGAMRVGMRGNDEFCRDLMRSGFPVVAVDHYVGETPPFYVGPDNRLGAKLAIEHLIELGHRRIAMASCRRPISGLGERREGYERTMADHGLAVDARWMPASGFTPEDGRGALASLLALPRAVRPTAVFCDNDMAAAGVILEARQRGVRIPEDLSVVGFAGFEWTQLLAVPLTTVAQNGEGIGHKAADLLFDLIDDPALKPQYIELAPKLVVRESSGPAARTQP